MNTKEILNRLKVMLNLEAEKEQMAKATLVDGTEVYTEGELAPGSILYVVGEEGDVLAPEGLHETAEGLLVSVGPAGEIISIEPKAPVEEPVEAMEEPKEEVEASKEEKEEDKVEAMEEPKEEVAENLLEGMVELLKPFIAELKALKEEVEQAKVKMQEIADQPAASRIKHSASKSKDEVDSIAVKLEKIKKIKNNK